ncbi:sensor histidine kinase [Streptomyces sp. VRA16 Mangrove soil]|uniref:sensor histidine kinase n=1 Tax=Streptomyces sp. VRA16 Mangrove soil TaxID=2817434 RepID=UPI001A9EA63B|nr:histidine kinase [Streptomyces sp. VRA16 Mangrove soil]MBO1335652.1 sensor histidine kinase [Streptomyces sp. VRA16 Mangrove soil]
MLQRPRRGDPFWIWLLHSWDLFSWVIVGLLAVITVLGDVPAGPRHGSLALLVVLGVAGAAVRRWGREQAVYGYAYLGLLIVVLGVLAGLRDGFGALYVVALTQFVVCADSRRGALVSSALGAVAIMVGGVTREGWGVDALVKNGISTVAVYAAGALIATLTPRALEVRDERARLRAQLASTQAELGEALRREGAAAERARMAREIHDTLAQGFASIVVLAEAAREGLEREPARTARQLTSIEQTARENLAEARALVGATPPPGGAVQGSVAATLRRTLDRFCEDTGIGVDAELDDVACDQQTRIALLRCTQESLANVRKHAGAGTVSVLLSRSPGAVELEITDDGSGFDVAAARGFGLDGMRKRLAELGGELTVTSSVGDGTRVLASLPTPDPDPDPLPDDHEEP